MRKAVLDLTFSGLPLVSGDTVTVRYSRPLVDDQATLDPGWRAAQHLEPS